MKRPHASRLLAGVGLALLLVGCGTTRMTDSPRAATEMLLVSQAADNAVAQIDFSPLAGQDRLSRRHRNREGRYR